MIIAVIVGETMGFKKSFEDQEEDNGRDIDSSEDFEVPMTREVNFWQSVKHWISQKSTKSKSKKELHDCLEERLWDKIFTFDNDQSRSEPNERDSQPSQESPDLCHRDHAS